VISDGSGFSIAIVFGNENDRKFPDAGEIESFMEGTLIASAITKETDGDLPLAIGLGSKTGSSREKPMYCRRRNASSDGAPILSR